VRVGYELTGLELDSAGPARYIRALRPELERIDGIELVPLRHGGAQREGTAGRILRGLHRELAYFPFQLHRRARQVDLDVLHCPAPLAPVRSSVPTVITLHDVLGLDHPEWFTRALALHSRLVLAPALRRAACVLVPSAYTRDRLVGLVGVKPEQVRLVPLGVDAMFSPGDPPEGLLERMGITGPYVLTVGTLQPRKNVESALRAFERLVAAGSDRRLAIVGGRGWRDEALAERIRRSPAAERVIVTGRVSDDDLVGLYRAADCFLYPSRYEGFGLPPLEAMACGTAVISSNRTSLPEVVGDAGVLVDPDDVDAIERALSKLLASPEQRSELVDRGRRRAAEFSWRRCAELTVGGYGAAIDVRGADRANG
jgi:glycosyltransferase involved in cell wall biosynthesis